MSAMPPIAIAVDASQRTGKPPDQLRGKTGVRRRAAQTQGLDSLNHRIGQQQHRRRNRDAQFIRYLPVHRQLEASRLCDR